MKYLGVLVSQDTTSQTHVNRTAAKASSTLGFLRCNLHSCTQDVCDRTYNMFILPTLNYASAAWDSPNLTGDVDQLEKVQRHGARYVKNNYHDRSPGCVTMLRDLQWLQLKEERGAHRLNYLRKIKNCEVDIDPGNIIQPSDSRT